MSWSKYSRVERSNAGICTTGGNWTGINIATMVAGFILFWPFGLFMIYWIMTGRSAQELPRMARGLWARMTGGLGKGHRDSDNVVFNEYQDRQYDRIREIKQEIDERARRFNEFREAARRRVDEKEFNEFMNYAPAPDAK